MQYLYLRFLNFRLWILRRRLRRLGFRDVAVQITPETLLHLLKNDDQKLILDWVKIALTTTAVISMWLIFWLRAVQPIQIVMPPGTPSLRPLPGATAPVPAHTGELPRHAA